MHNRPFFVLGLGLAVVAVAESSFYKANITIGDEEIIFNSTEIWVNVGDVVHLECGIKGHKDKDETGICIWMNNNSSYQVQDVYQGVYSSKGKPENTEGNQCGIVLKSIKNVDNGVWKCTIFLTGRNLAETKNIIVLVKPTLIDVQSKVLADSGVQTDVSCTVGKARPPAKITWALNDRDITDNVKEESVENFETQKKWGWQKVANTKEGTGGTGNRERDTSDDEVKMKFTELDIQVSTRDYKTTSTLSHNFNQNENGTKLKCIIAHPTLENPEIHEIPVIVGVAPIGVKEQNYYNISKNSNHTIEFEYTAIPKPIVHRWRIGGAYYEANSRLDGKFIASLNETENGHYKSELRIFNLADDDYKKYVYEVDNGIGGITLYNFNLFMHEKQEGALGGSNSINSVWFLYTLLSFLALFL